MADFPNSATAPDAHPISLLNLHDALNDAECHAEALYLCIEGSSLNQSEASAVAALANTLIRKLAGVDAMLSSLRGETSPGVAD
jgi:hypothetical protein